MDVIPLARDFRYVKSRSEIDELPWPVKEIKDLYASVIHQVALRTMWECFSVTGAEDVVDTVVFQGHCASDEPRHRTGRRTSPDQRTRQQNRRTT